MDDLVWMWISGFLCGFAFAVFVVSLVTDVA